VLGLLYPGSIERFRRFIYNANSYVSNLDSVFRRNSFLRFETAADVIPAKAGIHLDGFIYDWIPAFAGMTPKPDNSDK
jgi:hypothetical protein